MSKIKRIIVVAAGRGFPIIFPCRFCIYNSWLLVVVVVVFVCFLHSSNLMTTYYLFYYALIVCVCVNAWLTLSPSHYSYQFYFFYVKILARDELFKQMKDKKYSLWKKGISVLTEKS